MAGTVKRIAGPTYLLGSVTNIYTPPAATITTTIRHIHIANVTAVPTTFTLYVGATGAFAAGTELVKNSLLSGTGTWDYYCGLRMDSTDFLTGVAGTTSALVITIEGEQAIL